ncbi:hypothetical protein JD969_07280 [Planctomycetota bacterium]|nr:hypothetical protein JD969_07280 [Planctomycetota bacterium]
MLSRRQEILGVERACDSEAKFCKTCGYALVGLKSEQCPECGEGFDVSDLGSYATARDLTSLRVKLESYMSLLLAVVVMLLTPMGLHHLSVWELIVWSSLVGVGFVAGVKGVRSRGVVNLSIAGFGVVIHGYFIGMVMIGGAYQLYGWVVNI